MFWGFKVFRRIPVEPRQSPHIRAPSDGSGFVSQAFPGPSKERHHHQKAFYSQEYGHKRGGESQGGWGLCTAFYQTSLEELSLLALWAFWAWETRAINQHGAQY